MVLLQLLTLTLAYKLKKRRIYPIPHAFRESLTLSQLGQLARHSPGVLSSPQFESRRGKFFSHDQSIERSNPSRLKKPNDQKTPQVKPPNRPKPGNSSQLNMEYGHIIKKTGMRGPLLHDYTIQKTRIEKR